MNRINRNTIKRVKDESGFTLMEVTITIFIISLLIGVFLANYRGASRRTDLSFAAQQLASDIRLAQNDALGLAAYGGAAPAGGWGIHLDTTNNKTYKLFADTNNNKLYDSSPDEALPASGGQTVTLPNTISISGLQTGGTSRNAVDLTFLPPDPVTRIYYNSANTSSTDAVITLRESASGKTQDVNVNILGLIETQ